MSVRKLSFLYENINSNNNKRTISPKPNVKKIVFDKSLNVAENIPGGTKNKASATNEETPNVSKYRNLFEGTNSSSKETNESTAQVSNSLTFARCTNSTVLPKSSTFVKDQNFKSLLGQKLQNKHIEKAAKINSNTIEDSPSQQTNIEDLKQNFAQELCIGEDVQETDSFIYDYVDKFDVLSSQKNFSLQTHKSSNGSSVTQGSSKYKNIEKTLPTSNTTPVPPLGQQNSLLARHQNKLQIKHETSNDHLVNQGSLKYKNNEHTLPTSNATPVPPLGQQNSPLANRRANLLPLPIKHKTSNGFLVTQESSRYRNNEHTLPTSNTTPVPPLGQQNSPLARRQNKIQLKHETSNGHLVSQGSSKFKNNEHTLPTSRTTPVSPLGQQNSPLARCQNKLQIKHETSNDNLVNQGSSKFKNNKHTLPTSFTTPIPHLERKNSSLGNRQTNLLPIKHNTNNDNLVNQQNVAQNLCIGENVEETESYIYDYVDKFDVFSCQKNLSLQTHETSNGSLVTQESTSYQNNKHVLPTSRTDSVPPLGQQNSLLANRRANLLPLPIKHNISNDYLLTQGSTCCQNNKQTLPTSRSGPVPSLGQQNSPLAKRQTNLSPLPIKHKTNNDYLVTQQNFAQELSIGENVEETDSYIYDYVDKFDVFSSQKDLSLQTHETCNGSLVTQKSLSYRNIEHTLPTSSTIPVPPLGHQNSPLARRQNKLQLKHETSNSSLETKGSFKYKNIEQTLSTSNTTPVPPLGQPNSLLVTKTMLPIDGSTNYISPNTSYSNLAQNIMYSSQTATPLVPPLKNTQSIIDNELTSYLFHNVNAQKGFTDELRSQNLNEQVEYSNCIDIESKISDIIYGKVGLKFSNINDDQFFGDTVRQSFLSLQSNESLDDFDSDTDWDNDQEATDHQPNFTTTVQHGSIPLQDILKNPQAQNMKWSQIMNGYQIDTSHISQHERTVQDAKFELVASEWSFLKSIKVFYEQFVQKLFIVLSKNEERKLFAYVKEVKKCSENLLDDLEKCWNKNTFTDDFCEIILQNLEKNFEAYVQYSANQVYSEALLGEIVSDKTRTFKEFLDDIQCDPVCNGLHLHAYQLIPIKKINCFPILLENISHCLSPQNKEYQYCIQALNFTNLLLHQCNELVKQAKNHLKTKSLLEKFDFPKNVALKINEIGDKHMRHFIKSDKMELIKISKTLLGKKILKKIVHVFLFNDIFIIAQQNGNKYTVIDYSFRINLELNSDKFFLSVTYNIDTNKVLFVYIKENKDLQPIEIILSCETKTDAIRWTEALDPPDTAKTDTTFNFDNIQKVIVQRNYSAIHSDEINMTIGDIFTILRDTGDGWSFGQREKDGECGWFRNDNVLIVDDVKQRITEVKRKYSREKK